MNAIANLMAAVTALLTISAGSQIVNGIFAAGLDGWAVTGNVFPESGAASFNGNATSDSEPNGSISQTFPTVAGTTYTLTFSKAAVGSAIGSQALLVTAPGFSQSIVISKTTAGANPWTVTAVGFTATAASSTLTFKDASAATQGIDLLLDNVTVAITSPTTPQVAVLPGTGVCRLGWDPQPGIHFRVYRGIDLLATVEINRAAVTLPDSGVHHLEIVAFSPTLGVSAAPAPIEVQAIRFQASSDLADWKFLGPVIYREYSDKLFIRAQPSTASLSIITTP